METLKQEAHLEALGLRDALQDVDVCMWSPLKLRCDSLRRGEFYTKSSGREGMACRAEARDIKFAISTARVDDLRTFRTADPALTSLAYL